MATLLLGAVASAVVGATGATGLVASAITTAATLGGSLLDSFLFGGGSSQSVEGQRLDNLQVLSSTEGAAIPIVAGHARVSGQVIWATNLEEVVKTSVQSSGGKNEGGASTTTTEYTYLANFAVGICEGPISAVLRVWADGAELDLTELTCRIYQGTETQDPDPLIEAKQGAGNAPAYRGLAYVVFDALPLAAFGNRIPQLTFEVVRAVGVEEEQVQGVCIIPGTTEYGYSPTLVKDFTTGTNTIDNNRHTKTHDTDWNHSLDLLQSVAPNVGTVALVVAWFGTDLRAGSCDIIPKIVSTKTTDTQIWTVAGLDRETAEVVSYIEDKPAFGGSPNDATVIAAIQDLKSRGLNVLLYPFIMMDVPDANGLTDPYGAAEQAVYPWRGRITCNPAIGQPGTADQTATADGQISAFLGTATASDFGYAEDAITFAGPEDEWSYRRFILHLAKLADLAGGVDAFCIGTEMPGLTNVRGASGNFPFVDGLISLLGQVRSMLGGSVKLSYAADWSEYHSYRPDDGSGDVCFNLDPLWSDGDIDFIGIDNYLPLSDWRDGSGHLDHSAEYQSIHDPEYLKANIEGGEYYDWYYASDADRASQTRTVIEDTAHGDDWVFRQKDIKGWWQNAHHDRPGGVRDASATAWTAEEKPIWFTEFGCPAIDKGPNQPNVFYDPKSSESFVPHFSSGARDDLIQRRYIRATLDYWADTSGNNPVSGVYGGRMVDTSKAYVWAWDIRPFPSFPVASETWANHANFYTGHWISGRFGGAPADGLARLMLEKSGLEDGTDFDDSGFDGVADGYIIDNVASARSVLETLGASFFFDPMESGGKIVARSRRSRFPVLDLAASDCVDQGRDAEPVTIRRAQQTDLPRVVRLTAYDVSRDFEPVTGEGLLEEVTSDRVVVTDTPMVADYDRVQAIAESLLQEAWAGREGYSFALAESALALEPCDVVRLEFGGRSHLVRASKITDGDGRQVTGKGYDGPVYEPSRGLGRVLAVNDVVEGAAALGVFIDGPLLTDSDVAYQGYVTGYKLPFNPGLAFHSSPSESGYVVRATLSISGTIGELKTDLPTGPLYRWDMANSVDVELYSSSLQSLPETQVLAGGNALLVQSAGGDWELLQYANAELIGDKTYRLSRLLRGQRGSEVAMGAASGARVVVPTGGMAQSGLSRDQIGLPLNWQVGPSNGAVGDADFAAYEITMRGRGERPLSPVHLKATDGGGGDLVLSWIRRTRIGGDSWETSEVPLSEESEAYEIEIWKDGELKRGLSATAESVTYTAADQMADLGGTGVSFTFFVFQISATYGRGSAAQKDYQP